MVELDILLSFFTRDNPTGDRWITQGFGPTKRTYAPEKIPMKNYDNLLETRVVPFEESTLDLVSLLSQSPGGEKWLDACRKYTEALNKTMPVQMPFIIKPRKMDKPMHYVQDLNHGPEHSPDYCDILTINSIPAGMIAGTFAPEFRVVPWEESPSKIGMACNGGVIFSDNRRGKYTIQEGYGGICLTVPAIFSLLGEMPKGSLLGSEWVLHDFPRTHFLEWVFARHCYPEPAPQPAIRIELNPSDPNNTTLRREARWIVDRKMRDERDKELYQGRPFHRYWHPRPIECEL